MQTCETCRHWSRADFSHYQPDGFGHCVYAMMRLGSGAVDQRRAFTMSPDYSGYESALFTRADFGCIAHEPRE